MKTSTEAAALGASGAAAEQTGRTGFDRLLYHRWYPGALHYLLLAALAILIWFAFAPGQRGEGNLATEVVWRLWWPGLPFILLLGGRVWCGICPFGAASDLTSRIRKHAPAAPAVLRRWGPWLGAFSVLAFGMAFLALGLEANAGATAAILIGMTVLAISLSLAFRGRTLCRYLCPVGMITRVYSFFSWLRPLGSQVKYQGAACPIGQSPSGLRQPSQCQLCGTCTRPGEAGGITVKAGYNPVQVPGRLEFGRPEALLSLLLLGLMASDSVRMTSLFARYQQFALPYFNYNYRLTVIVGVTTMVSVVLALTLAGSRMAARRSGIDPEAALSTAGSGKANSGFESAAFTYLPLTLGVFLALALQHLWSGLWPSLQTVLVESRLIDWSGHMPPKNVYFTSLVLKSIQFLLLGTGLFFSLKTARIARGAKSEIWKRRMLVLITGAGFGFLFLLPMSGAC